jgi:phage shock protein PspC (stress-responsive transcriptional regulator)
MYAIFDPVAILFYAGVCAGLAAFAPASTGRGKRLAIGAAVGLIAALILPNLRQMIGI